MGTGIYTMALLLSKLNALARPNRFYRLSSNLKQYLSSDTSSGDLYPPPSHIVEPWIPPYEERTGESMELRKRGMLENGLLLSTFASRYLKDMTETQTSMYDQLINLPSNDWDIFYWATGVRETPTEFDNEIMNLLKEHVKNKDREARLKQPDL